MLLELPVASITARLPAWIPLAAGAAMVGLGMAATGIAHGLAALVLTVALWTLGEVTAAPVTQAFVADLAPPGLQGRYQGTLSFVTGMAFILAPGLGGWLFGWSQPALWTTCAVSGLAAMLMFVAIGRVRHARTVEAELASLAAAE
jgi:MFS family permease